MQLSMGAKRPRILREKKQVRLACNLYTDHSSNGSSHMDLFLDNLCSLACPPHCPKHARSDALINCTRTPFTGVIITFGAPDQCLPAFSLGLTGSESTESSGWGRGLDFAVQGVWNNTGGDFTLEICEKGKKHALGHALPGYRLELSVNEDCFQCLLYRKSGNLGYRGGKVQQYPLHVELHTKTKSIDVRGLVEQNVVKAIEWGCAKTPAHTEMCCDMAARELELEERPASKRPKVGTRTSK